MIRFHKNQTGDTIVEVMIAILVVSAVLGGAYVTSNHSLKNTRQAQEHAVALKYAESQLEQIKSLPTATILSLPGSFCMDGNGAVAPSAPCTQTDGIDYTVTVTKVASGASFIFTAGVTWPSIISGSDQVSLIYKVSP
jgi:Tfp pilus assembly protein PilV